MILATQLGDDLPGRLVGAHLGANGVSVELLPAVSSSTSLALAALDDHGIASYHFRLAWDLTRRRTLPPTASACTPGHWPPP